jgi:hypothetical protein
MRTRHVWLIPALNVGPELPGFVMGWRQTARKASTAIWEAHVVYVDRAGATRIEWVPAMYLRPEVSERPRT